jgi:predicted esterase
VLSTTIFSQNYEVLNSTNYVEKFYGNTITDKNTPIIFAFHYMGSDPEEFEKLFSDIDFPVKVVYVAGECEFENGYSFYPVEYYDIMSDEEKGLVQAKTAEKINAFIAEYKKQGNNNSPSIVIGVSQGGDLSYLLALNYPDQFVLSVPIAASIEKKAINKVHFINKNQHIYPFHGTLDKIVPINEARETCEYLKIQGFNVNLIEFENKGHEVSIEMKEKYKSLIKECILLNR